MPLLPHEQLEHNNDSTSSSTPIPLLPHERLEPTPEPPPPPPPRSDITTLQGLPHELLSKIVTLAISPPLTEPTPWTTIPTRSQALTNVAVPNYPGIALDPDRSAFILGPKPPDGFAHITGYDMRVAQDLASVSLLLLSHVRTASLQIGKFQSAQQTRLRLHTPPRPEPFTVRCHSDFNSRWCERCTARLTATYRYQKCVDNLDILKMYSFKRRIVVWKLEVMMHKKARAGCREHSAQNCICGQQLEVLAANRRGLRVRFKEACKCGKHIEGFEGGCCAGGEGADGEGAGGEGADGEGADGEGSEE